MLRPIADLLSSPLDESLIDFGLRGCYHINGSRVYQIKVSQKFFPKLATKKLVDNLFCFAYSFLWRGTILAFFQMD